jgi:hypothetical protein
MQQDLFNWVHYNGESYEAKYDQKRLQNQTREIFNLMKDEKWRTLRQIEVSVKFPQSSISAQLRHLRKPRFGNHIVNKRFVGERETGLWEYQLIVNKNQEQQL